MQASISPAWLSSPLSPSAFSPSPPAPSSLSTWPPPGSPRQQGGRSSAGARGVFIHQHRHWPHQFQHCHHHQARHHQAKNIIICHDFHHHHQWTQQDHHHFHNYLHRQLICYSYYFHSSKSINIISHSTYPWIVEFLMAPITEVVSLMLMDTLGRQLVPKQGQFVAVSSCSKLW